MATHETRTSEDSERAILVGLILPASSYHAEETLNELALLADTAGAVVLDRVVQERKRVDPGTFVGQGKAEELAERVEELEADVVIFDDDLSPGQVRNLEELLQVKVIDRSRLILDIFARRAQTHEAQTQVELAQLEYMLPRLMGQWTHLSRQQAGHGGATGGIGTRGPGETQLEVDRRALRVRIRSLRKALDRIVRQRQVGRRRRSGSVRVSLVGYTNAGKSTLMRALSGADVFVEDRLFATLDSTTRAVYLGYNREILLTDTVGFIRKLPHHLVASFRSTLEEVVEADLLLHVVDASHPACDEQIAAVFETLAELGIAENPLLMVLNKSDALPEPGLHSRLSVEHPDGVWTSATTGDGLEDLRAAIYDRLEGERVTLSLQVPQADGKLLSELHTVGEILSQDFEGNDVLLEVRMSREHADRMLPGGKYQIKA